MKKILLFVAFVAVSALFASCGPGVKPSGTKDGGIAAGKPKVIGAEIGRASCRERV